MLFPKCPSHETLMEFVTIPQELPLVKRAVLQFHVWYCKNCQKETQSLQSVWKSYFSPEPDITSSLLRVYSRLQNDETLILKGWKLGEFRKESTLQNWLFKEGWLFRGGISVAAISLLVLVVSSQMRTETSPRLASQHSITPYAQIRFEDEKQTKVRYVRPELLQSVEFETTSTR